MAWLCRVDTLCDTITTLIYDLMDGPCLFSWWGLQAFQRVDSFVYARRRVGISSLKIPATRYLLFFPFSAYCFFAVFFPI